MWDKPFQWWAKVWTVRTQAVCDITQVFFLVQCTQGSGNLNKWCIKYGNETLIADSSGPVVVHVHINKGCLLCRFLHNVSLFHMRDLWPSDFSTIITPHTSSSLAFVSAVPRLAYWPTPSKSYLQIEEENCCTDDGISTTRKMFYFFWPTIGIAHFP